MTTPRCIWGKDTGDDLLEITVSGLGKGGVPHGEKCVWVCPEHRQKTESYFAFVKRHGYRISMLLFAVTAICFAAEAMALCGMFREPFAHIPWVAIFQISLLVLLPYTSWTLAAQPSNEEDWYIGVKHRLRWTKILAGIMVGVAVLIFSIKFW